ncbi:MAG: prepilin-type N-terminal cleavage/methylation domain-containing protein [Planctomycetales bacterium]|nr:prepilin-type N-terminal cleavage/methylation domain-containing protein [Planctomycetales bacterium]
MFHRRRSSSRIGFTLLEVILSLALLAIAMVLVGGAINFYFKQLTVRQTKIEEAQLARALLQQIARDLRGTVAARSADFASIYDLQRGLDDALAAVAGTTEDEEGTDEASETDGVEETDEEDVSSADALVDSAAQPIEPGIYGNAFEIQIDVSRIPRYEEYTILSSSGATSTLSNLSDVKTVSYFVLGQGGSMLGSAGNLSGSLGTQSLGANYQTGLVRRSMSRAQSRFASQYASFDQMDNSMELIAPEVVSLEFSYFDGFQWMTSWDTQQFGGIPLAVRITLVLQTTADVQRQQQSGPLNSVPTVIDPENIYQLVVHLPAGELIETEEESTTDETSSSSTSSSSTSSGSSATGSAL